MIVNAALAVLMGLLILLARRFGRDVILVVAVAVVVPPVAVAAGLLAQVTSVFILSWFLESNQVGDRLRRDHRAGRVSAELGASSGEQS